MTQTNVRLLLRIWIFVVLPFLLLVHGLRADEPSSTGNAKTHWSFRPVANRPIIPEPDTTSGPPAPESRHASGMEPLAERKTPLDAFVAAKLAQHGLTFNHTADRATLLRRITFDLTGLPPTPAELDDFLRDSCPDAYERVVERLLASSHFGERWAQHWLDVARFAETNGFEGDSERPHAWRYRDYVVDAFNRDKPFNRFLTEQIAGDLLVRQRPKEASTGIDKASADWLIAAGFNRCGPDRIAGGNADADLVRYEQLTEMANGVGAAFLGLTVGCARCHDHKFDPISQADYYHLQAFFGAAQLRELDIATSGEKAEYERRLQEFNARLEPLQKAIEEIDAPHRQRLSEAKKAQLEQRFRQALLIEPKKRTPEQATLAEHAETLIRVSWDEILADLITPERDRRAGLRARLHEIEASKPLEPAKAWTIREGPTLPLANLLKRGDPTKKVATLAPAFPQALVSEAEQNGTQHHATADSHSGFVLRVQAFLAGYWSAIPITWRTRLDLADWLTSRKNPLVARVIVNRLWQHHFGRGLVATPNDFGKRGELPSHPELLDWLAQELIDHDWSLKHLHCLMVLSQTYRQDSRGGDPRAAKIDPDNRLLWRMNRRRLDGEAIRDSILAAGGMLNKKMGGPSIKTPLEPEVYELIFTEGEPDGLWLVTPDEREHGRRSLYLYRKRNLRLPLLEAFDQPNTLTSCAVRGASTFAPQALIMQNGPELQHGARLLAERLVRESSTNPSDRIEHAYRIALGRPPTQREKDLALAFLKSQAASLGDKGNAERNALVDYCLALLNCSEFVFLR